MPDSEYKRLPGQPAMDPSKFPNFGHTPVQPLAQKASEREAYLPKPQLSRTPKPFEAVKDKGVVPLSVQLSGNITVYPPSGALSVDLIDEFETFSKMMQKEGYKKRSDALRLALAIGMLVCQGKWK